MWSRNSVRGRVCCSTIVSGIVLLTVLIPHRLKAQTSDVVAARLATITTDTGALAPGHHDFSRYTTLDLCRAATAWTERVARGTLTGQADSLHRLATQDTLGASAAARVARTCGARFPLRSVVTLQDFTIQLGLALTAQDLPQAQAIVTKAVTAFPAQAGAIRLNAIAYSLDSVFPANVGAATAFVAQLDAVRPSAVVDRMSAHYLLLDFWQRTEDTLQLRREAVQVLALANSTSPTALGTIGYQIVERTYRHLLRFVWWATPDSVSAVAQRACQDLNHLAVTWEHDCAHPTEAQTKQVLGTLMPWVGSLQWPSAPPVTADFWFPVAPGDTVVPSAGRVTLVVGVNLTYERKIASPEFETWSWSARHFTEHLRQWLTTYGPHGFGVTVAAATHGYALFRGTLSPAEEAQVIRGFVQDGEHLPVTVAVRTTPVQFRPPPDGRRILTNDSTLYGNDALYFGDNSQSTPYVLIGRDGTILLQTNDPVLVEEGLRRAFTPLPHP